MKPIQENIRKIRELKDFSQEYMARELDISQSQYSKIEQGNKELTLTMLDNIAAVFGISRRVLEDFSVEKLFSEQEKKADKYQPVSNTSENTHTMQILWDQYNVEVSPLPIMYYYRQ